MKGLFVVMSNPKVALGRVAIASYMFGPGLLTWQVAAFAPLASLSAVLVYGSYALLLSTESLVRTYRRFWRIIEGVLGSLFGAMGASLMIPGIRHAQGN